MRIRYVLLNAYERGGTIRTTLSMASTLAERDHDVEVASVTQNRWDPTFPVSPRVRLRSLTGPRPTWRSWQRPVGTLRWFTRAALHSTDTRACGRDSRSDRLSLATDWYLTGWLGRQHDCVVVGTRLSLNVALARRVAPDRVTVVQEHSRLTPDPEMRAEYRRVFPGLDAVVTLTERERTAYRRLLGGSVRIETIPNAVPDLGRPRPTNHAGTVAVAAGALVRRKGFDLLIDAWRDVVALHPDWTLHIHGSGELAGALQQQVDDAALTGHVRLVGFTSDLPAALTTASMFVLSSRSEGMPMVLLEALGCGLPVVSFDCPHGPRDLIDDGRNGVLVPPEDPRALGAAINRLIADPALRRRLGDAGSETARSHDRQSVADRWERLFADLAAARGVHIA